MVSWYFSNSKVSISRIMAKWIATMENRKSIFEQRLYQKIHQYMQIMWLLHHYCLGLVKWRLFYLRTEFTFIMHWVRRKKNVLLVYPRDQHAIVIKENKMDPKRITDWFDNI
jgi:hypothetical protein